jgi:hypothetical protein
MGWALMDDDLTAHPKVIDLLSHGPDGWAALGLWSAVLAWAHKYTDPARPELAGYVPPSLPLQLAGLQGPAWAKLLVESRGGRTSGLWDELPDGGWRVHDYAYWQQLEQWKSRSEQAKAAAGARWQQHRAAQIAGDAGSNAGAYADSNAGAMPTTDTHTREANASRNNAGTALASSDRPELARLCSLLADLIVENGSKRPNVTKTWLDECRRLMDIDGRSPQQVENMIRWCQRDGFWRGNILSMPTLRRQYDKMRLAAMRDAERPTGANAKAQRGLSLAQQYRERGE